MIATMNKETRLNLRITELLREDIETLAAYHGLSMSSYAHSLLVKSIRQAKEQTPEAFPSEQPERRLAPVLATITPAIDPKAEVRRMINDEELAEAARRTTPRKTQRMAVLKQKAK